MFQLKNVCCDVQNLSACLLVHEMGDNSVQEKPTVLVTGFEPFSTHVINASWVAVKEMHATGGLGEDVNLIVLELPVCYESVESLVPELWKQYQPKLVVHVGVSGIAKDLTLEQQAHNDGYDKPDEKGRCPPSKCCKEGGATILVSAIDMMQVCQAVKQSGCGVDSCVSHDPGRYLCDFIYYSSLSIDPARTAFIHVPPLNRRYNSGQLAEALRAAIRAMIDQI